LTSSVEETKVGTSTDLLYHYTSASKYLRKFILSYRENQI